MMAHGDMDIYQTRERQFGNKFHKTVMKILLDLRDRITNLINKGHFCFEIRKDVTKFVVCCTRD